jgi:hypothetical protein
VSPTGNVYGYGRSQPCGLHGALRVLQECGGDPNAPVADGDLRARLVRPCSVQEDAPGQMCNAVFGACATQSYLEEHDPPKSHVWTQAVPYGAELDRGEYFGVSQSAHLAPFCSTATPQNAAFVALVSAPSSQEYADFSFSTIQVNRGSRPFVQCDLAILGFSLTIGLGPYTGGALRQSLGGDPVHVGSPAATLPPWKWTLMDGSSLTSGTPCAGVRPSHVLVSHVAALRLLTTAVAAQTARIGVARVPFVSAAAVAAQDTCHTAKAVAWWLSAAQCKVAEVFLDGASQPHKAMVCHVQVESSLRLVVAAAVQRMHLLLLAVACQAKLGGVLGGIMALDRRLDDVSLRHVPRLMVLSSGIDSGNGPVLCHAPSACALRCDGLAPSPMPCSAGAVACPSLAARLEISSICGGVR